MTLIASKVATDNDTEVTLKIDKATQQLDIVRYAPLSVLLAGLLLGLPELVSAEISHPVRERARPANAVPLSHIAYWAQHGKGPIAERATTAVKAVTNQAHGYINPAARPAVVDLQAVGYTSDQAVKGLYKLTVTYFLNDKGPIEVLADDHYKIIISKLIPGSKYDFWAPEQPAIPVVANKYTKFEPGIILADDREVVLPCANKMGIIFPNLPAIIQRILVTYVGTDSKELSLEEIATMQGVVNPNILTLNYKAGALDTDFSQVTSHNMDSGSADLLLLDFTNVEKIQIDTVLGVELKYTIVSLQDRL